MFECIKLKKNKKKTKEQIDKEFFDSPEYIESINVFYFKGDTSSHVRVINLDK